MNAETALSVRSQMIEVQCRGIGKVHEQCGRDYAVVAADASACAGLAVLADLCGRPAAVQHAYLLADNIPLPEAQFVSSFRVERRAAMRRAAIGLIERAAFTLAGLVLGIWFTLAHWAH